MYQQPIDALLGFLKQQYLNAPFKEFYNGDPDVIPDFNLPALSVSKNNDRMEKGPTGFQSVYEELVIRVIYNKKEDWTADLATTRLTEQKIRDIVEARDPDTGAYLENTLKHALMHRFEMEGIAIDNNLSFELGIVPRPDDAFTQEGHLTISVQYLVPNVFTT